MAVLMEEIHSDGSRRQCNARCHNAKKPKCRCICGGHFHGAGRTGKLNEMDINTETEEIYHERANSLMVFNKQRALF